MKNTAFTALAIAALSLSACSSEPSDWRADKKVSLDMVEPGSRRSDNFDQHTEAAASQHKGGAIERPVSSGVNLDRREKPSVQRATSANAEEALHTQSNEPADEKAQAAEGVTHE